MSDSDPWFTMGVMNALAVISEERPNYPKMTVEELAAVIRESRSNDAAFDYTRACQLANRQPSLVQKSVAAGRDLFFRETITCLVDELRPGWRLLATRGRSVLLDVLDDNVWQVFDAAGLTEDPCGFETRLWWDRFAGNQRLSGDQARLAAGRQAEERTLSWERLRLSDQGWPQLSPKWIGFEDNTAGYDVKSFQILQGRAVPRLIEVKYSAEAPPTFFLSRNEWDTAILYPSDYLIHIWVGDAGSPIEVAVDELSLYIPRDRPNGRWLNVAIQLRQGQ